VTSFSFDAIGTGWEIESDEPLSGGLRGEILNRIRRFDATYSRFRRDSLVSRVAAASDGGRFEFPDDAIPLFDLYDRLFAASGGAVDPLVGRELELLGYDADYSLRPAREKRRRGSWTSGVIRDGATVTTRHSVVIDVGAAGKGYLVDIVSKMLRQAGIARFVVDASGDLRHAGDRGVRVGLEHPYDPRSVIGVARVQDRALCASAVNRRMWGDGLHHLIDARSGVPAREVVATWVIADDTATADGLATALFFTEPRRLAEDFRFTYVRMFVDGRADTSPDFDGELFT
jgi:thiamine biosynthesis lipoprotein